MARPHIQPEPSPYYPPRARWYSQLYYLAQRFRFQPVLDRFQPPPEIKLFQLIAAFLVPGLGIYFRGARSWGALAMAASAVMALVFIIFLGYAAANLGFGLMISLHCTGFVYYCGPMVKDSSFLHRLRFTLLALLGIGLAIYLPLRNAVQDHCLTPLQYKGSVVVVQRIFPTGEIRRGEWVAYLLHETSVGEAHNGGAIYAHGGAGLGPVLATAGDLVRFGSNTFSVNGIEQPARPMMPTAGALTVAADHWFIWPEVNVYSHGVSQATITASLMDRASVNQTQFIGKPFQSWFGRKQNLP